MLHSAGEVKQCLNSSLAQIITGPTIISGSFNKQSFES